MPQIGLFGGGELRSIDLPLDLCPSLKHRLFGGLGKTKTVIRKFPRDEFHFNGPVPHRPQRDDLLENRCRGEFSAISSFCFRSLVYVTLKLGKREFANWELCPQMTDKLSTMLPDAFDSGQFKRGFVRDEVFVFEFFKSYLFDDRHDVLNFAVKLHEIDDANSGWKCHKPLLDSKEKVINLRGFGACLVFGNIAQSETVLLPVVAKIDPKTAISILIAGHAQLQCYRCVTAKLLSSDSAAKHWIVR